jgi:hypothetical protein
MMAGREEYPVEWDEMIDGAFELMEVRTGKNCVKENRWVEKNDSKVYRLLTNLRKDYESGNLPAIMKGFFNGVVRNGKSSFEGSEYLVYLLYREVVHKQ